MCAAAVFTEMLARVISLRLCFSRKQALLVGIEQDLLLGLAAEDLPLEPRRLCLEFVVLDLKRGDADRCRIGCAYGVNCLFRRAVYRLTLYTPSRVASFDSRRGISVSTMPHRKKSSSCLRDALHTSLAKRRPPTESLSDRNPALYASANWLDSVTSTHRHWYAAG